MTNLEKLIVDQSQMIGANARFFAILVASMHVAGMLNGRAVAQSIRLDEGSPEEYRLSVADLICRTIDEGRSRATITDISDREP